MGGDPVYGATAGLARLFGACRSYRIPAAKKKPAPVRERVKRLVREFGRERRECVRERVWE
jgi:hypothetical protein